MAEIIVRDGKALYACTICGLLYTNEQTAGRCEAWCSEHKSCNIEIIKAAVGSKRDV